MDTPPLNSEGRWQSTASIASSPRFFQGIGKSLHEPVDDELKTPDRLFLPYFRNLRMV
jgi:hypothetical protein